MRQAYNSFAAGKLPGKDVILKTARNFYDKAIAKVPTKKIVNKIRQDIKKDKPENLHAANTTRFVEGAKKGTYKGWTPRVIKGGKKADGGRIDKPLPTRSRDI
jgi:hypothetical protein